jgi:hypothetical protein
MSVIIATNPPVEAAGLLKFRYTCSHCGKEWDGPPPTFEEGRVCIVTLTFCSEGCADQNVKENTVIHAGQLQ